LLPHRELPSPLCAHHQHPTLSYPGHLAITFASSVCCHTQSSLLPCSHSICPPIHTTNKHIHTTPTHTMVTRPTPTSANAMDTRTPQNTPAQNAPISSRAQAPSVSDIKEGSSYSTCNRAIVAGRTVQLTAFEQRTSTAPPPLPSSHRTLASFR
jgi:hypothetical protein